MDQPPIWAFMALSAFMFSMGAIGVVVKRNPIVIFMCVELMLNAANLSFLALARTLPNMADRVNGQVLVVFIMAVAAAEVAVVLGIIVSFYRLRHTIDIDDLSLLRG